jgi:hypothetical protein
LNSTRASARRKAFKAVLPAELIGA